MGQMYRGNRRRPYPTAMLISERPNKRGYQRLAGTQASAMATRTTQKTTALAALFSLAWGRDMWSHRARFDRRIVS
jgi:hypothetical protein